MTRRMQESWPQVSKPSLAEGGAGGWAGRWGSSGPPGGHGGSSAEQGPICAPVSQYGTKPRGPSGGSLQPAACSPLSPPSLADPPSL